MQLQRQESTTTTEDEGATQFRPHKNTYEFDFERGRKLTLSSNFDNGNIALIKQISEVHYRLEAVPDFKTSVARKTWFHFWVSAPKRFKIRFTVENVSIYDSMYEEHNWPKPVYKDERGFWLPITNAFLTCREEVGLAFDHTFHSDSPVYFALTVPHSYDENEMYLRELVYRMPQQIRYSDQIVATTRQNLNVHMLRLTHKDETEIETSKPFIVITCRVHPGEVGSTYCLMGIIDFLIRSFSLQAHLLLQMFEFIIFPMVNPDGVFGGNYRMDLNNTNLNRVYGDPNPEMHPPIYAIKQQINKLVNNKLARKCMFHFDLHSHSSLKPAFIYGNAFDEIATQTESALFCRLLEHNSEVFRYGSSHFTERHMKMKDRGENMTKEGCARVVLSKLANITYSYTVQTSIFDYPNRQPLAPPDHSDFRVDPNSFYDNVSMQSMYARFGTKSQMVIDNVLLGYGLMTTILDIFTKNPYTRIPLLEEVIEGYRKQISQSMLQNEQRFKLMDTKAYQKVKMISKLIKEEYKNKYQRGWNYLAIHPVLSLVEWPTTVKWFELLPEDKKPKNARRIKTEAVDSNKRMNELLYPKNVKKNAFLLQGDLLAQKVSISPVKEGLSPNRYINLELPNPKEYLLPEIKSPGERNAVLSSNRYIAHSSIKKKNSQQLANPHPRTRIETDPSSYPSLEAKQIQQLTQRESTKNIVLSFIHEEIQRMSNIKKNPMKTNPRLNNQRAQKKNSCKSLKVLFENNTRLEHQSASRKKMIATDTCEDIVNRRKINIHEVEDDQRTDVLSRMLSEKQIQKRVSKGNRITGNSHRDPSHHNKRQIARIKYSEIKRKNIIRQEIAGNVKLPELRLFQANSNLKPGSLYIDARTLTMTDEG